MRKDFTSYEIESWAEDLGNKGALVISTFLSVFIGIVLLQYGLEESTPYVLLIVLEIMLISCVIYLSYKVFKELEEEEWYK